MPFLNLLWQILLVFGNGFWWFEKEKKILFHKEDYVKCILVDFSKAFEMQIRKKNVKPQRREKKFTLFWVKLKLHVMNYFEKFPSNYTQSHIWNSDFLLILIQNARVCHYSTKMTEKFNYLFGLEFFRETE